MLFIDCIQRKGKNSFAICLVECFVVHFVGSLMKPTTTQSLYCFRFKIKKIRSSRAKKKCFQEKHGVFCCFLYYCYCHYIVEIYVSTVEKIIYC